MSSRERPTQNLSMSAVKKRVGWLTLLLAVTALVIFSGPLNGLITRLNERSNIGIPTIFDKPFQLGLDLKGGAHLVYQAKVDDIAPADRPGALQSVRDIIERRVRGGLSVAEPVVETAQSGSDYRLIVELPGVTDVSKATELIRRTPILEFKEENTEPPRALTKQEEKQLTDFNKAAEKKAKDTLLNMAKSTSSFESFASKLSEDEATKVRGGDMDFVSSTYYPELAAWAAGHKNGEVSKEVIQSLEGYNIIKRIAVRDGQEVVSAAHLLLCYKGAERCDNPTLSRDEAKKKIDEIRTKATPQNFGELVKQHSTEPGAAAREGDLGSFPRGVMVKEFEDAVWPMATGTISQVVETPFGFHIIYKKNQSFEKEYRLARILFKTKSAADIVPPSEQWKSTGLTGKYLERAEVVQDPRSSRVQVSLAFDEEGAKLFGEITARNINKILAIFLDGEPISLPRVNEPILSGTASISGDFNLLEAQKLAQNLNLGALPVPVELISQKNVDATLGADSLAKSFRAGIYGLIAIMIFMILYYRLPGTLSVVSLVFYTMLSLAVFKILGVTMTLSGIAGFILSIGMAVDANILVFERLKEELQAGKTLRSAVEESFTRSWPSIRDGHVAALISCVFLMWFGSGFVQGFATILALGTLINLFTAITITRTIMRFVMQYVPAEGGWYILGSRRSS